MGVRSVFIFGAGEFGHLIYHLLLKDEYNVKYFIDDNKKLHGRSLFGKKILSRKETLKHLDGSEIIIVAIRSRSEVKNNLSEIKEWLARLKTNFFFLPDFKFFLENGLSFKEALPKDYETFLNRSSHSSSYPLQEKFFKNKSILITGAGGSIGSELLMHLEKFKTKKIIGIDKNEEGIFWLKMKSKKSDLKIIDCKIEQEIESIFVDNQIDIVINAAAYKHVPLFEENLDVCWTNNLKIVENLSRLSSKFGVKNFLQVSSDKAVNPTNTMGASKRVSELYLLSYFKRKKCKVTITRFGNVLGSSGSVLKIFEKQFDEKKPITVTDSEITRYFMSISEAVVLLSESIIHTNSSGLFVLNMGNPVKILDLAKNFLSSKNVEPKIGENIILTGLRKGEKMFEEILFPEEMYVSENNDKIFVVQDLKIESDFLTRYNLFKKTPVTKKKINDLIKEYNYE